MRGKWVWISIAAVLAGVAAGALSLRLRQEKPMAAPRRSGAALIPASEITVTGKIRPQHVTDVPAPEEGNIDEFMADVGQDVFEGQVLARIGGSGLESARESATAQAEHAQEQVSRAETGVNGARLEASRADADLERARATLDRAGQVWSRQKTLFAAGATPRLAYEKSQQEFDSAQADFTVMNRAAQASREVVQGALDHLEAAKEALAERMQQLDEAQGNLQNADLRSPVDGLVLARNGEAGKPAQEAGGALFQIATDMYALEVTIEPGPPVLKRMHPGQAVLVLILDLQSAGIPGDVKSIEGTQAVVEFNNPLPAVKPGMQAAVRLRLE